MHDAIERGFLVSELLATYVLTHREDEQINRKAEQIALGLTVGSWTDLPQLKKEQLQKHKGRVEKVLEKAVPAENGLYQSEVTIAYPEANFSADLPAVFTTIFGKLSLDGKVKLVDIQFSEEFKKACQDLYLELMAYEKR